MDPGPPDSKRQRLSWSASTPQGVTLPHPNQSSSRQPQQRPPPPQLSHPPGPPGAVAPAPPPPPINTQSHGHHHQAGPSPYQSYPPRPGADQSPAPAQPLSHEPQQHQHQHPEADRRHHDQEPYAPMQDHYRQQQPRLQQQPPSPAHPAYLPYAHRDSAIKREEDIRRPNSTGHGPDGVPHTPHSATTNHAQPPHPASGYPESQPRHMSFDNGPSATGGYRHAPFQPPTPISHQPPPYDQLSYASGGEPFYSVYSSAVAAKKKNTRASQACDQCRQLKAKCDETKPCKTCRDKGTECRYRDPVPKAADKTQADILDGIAAVQSSIATITDHISRNSARMEYRMNKVEAALARPGASLYIKSDNIRDDEIKSAPVTPFPTNGDGIDGPYYPAHMNHDASTMSEHAHLRLMVEEDEIEADPGPPVPPGEPAIPINHTTLANLLLDWPSIREMTKHHLENQGVRFVSEFPISQEQSRGSLIVYGRGEDSHYSRQTRELTDHGSLDVADDLSDTASSSPNADFGYMGGLSPADHVDYRGGVLGADGNPDFSETRVWQYVESFKENMLNMHPIVQPKVLDYWVRHFLDTLPTANARSTKPLPRPAFAVNPGAPAPNEAPGSKRKRSPGFDGSDGSTAPPAKVGKPSRSLHSALVLTVLALGKICLHRDNVPDVVPHMDQPSHGSPHSRNGVMPSPSQGSPPGFSSHTQSSSHPSPMDTDRVNHTRRSSIQGVSSLRSGYQLKKNYEVIPGLEYFALATDILGNHEGSYNNMKAVYANIFAGLYHGQLARPMESFAFIHKASHKLQVLMRPSLDKLRRYKQNSEFIRDPKYNQLALAFWTCLQLESDLIAEMPMPTSGLLSYEDDVPHPNMSLLEGFDQRVLDSYPGQLYMRTHLNRIHRMFYSPEDRDKPETDKFSKVGLVSGAVSGMNWVAPSFAFKEEDLPADDILSVRLRAKYWGAQVITYRPFIREILQFSHSRKNHPSSPALQKPDFQEDIISSVIQASARTPNDINPQVIWLAQKGINALINSTSAFHRLGDERPIITNVFGTAHAQWGHLLVLAAAFNDPILHQYVDEDVLKSLFARTVHFLRQSAPSTSSLRIDMSILEGVQRDLFQSQHPRTNSSFSSHAGAPTPQLATVVGLPPAQA